MLLAITYGAIILLVLGVGYAVSIAPPLKRGLVVAVFIGLAAAGYATVYALHAPADAVARFYDAVGGAIGGLLIGFVWVSTQRKRWSYGSDASSADPTASRHHRKLANYLLDRKLQLRYVLFVTILSAVISSALGYMIYDQRRMASESIERDLQALTKADASHQEFQEQVASGLESDDQMLIYRMVGVGLGLVLILSAYLVIMTHKVAGPLFKVSMYFEQMAEGRLGPVTPLRRGDMLQDFFGEFKAMHESLRVRALGDADIMERAVSALRASQAGATGEARRKLDDTVEALDRHVAQRKKQLA